MEKEKECLKKEEIGNKKVIIIKKKFNHFFYLFYSNVSESKLINENLYSKVEKTIVGKLNELKLKVT